MEEIAARLQGFVDYCETLQGDEKGEAQVFCDRLFQAFGHKGYKEAGATLEYRVIQKGSRTKFADLVWKPRLLLEMKSRGTNLLACYKQAFNYWIGLVPHRPQYVVLCNFDEFWIYDFDQQVDDPVDRIAVGDLPTRNEALAFLLPDEREPQFRNNRVAVTRGAAAHLACLFNSIVSRGEDRAKAQRFVLQCLVAMFSEDIGLIPSGLFTGIVGECRGGKSTYDLIGGLFRQMNDAQAAPAGRFINVPYFNGGLFATIEPLDLTKPEVDLLYDAAKEDWSRVHPAIFGQLFQSSMGKEEKHAHGTHFTSEADIQRIVGPTIGEPWRARIRKASQLNELVALRKELLRFRVLDPACGSGNFLYVAYREVKRIEAELVAKAFGSFKAKARDKIAAVSQVSTHQFFGIDNTLFATELAKVTLMLAKKLALDEVHQILKSEDVEWSLSMDQALPLDNLDANVFCEDALFCKWPEADAIVGNPPYQAKNKMVAEFGQEYVNRVRKQYAEVPGRSDYCVYWFRRAHDELPEGGRAGLVGTNTIRENYSREGGLGYISMNGGTITEAVSTQVWPGDAAVHVSIVNWVKGKQKGKKKLLTQLGDSRDSPWRIDEVDVINAALSAGTDVTGAKSLQANSQSEACYQGQTHGHKGFLLTPEVAGRMSKDRTSRAVIHPYLTGDDLVGNVGAQPSRFAIDLNHCDDLIAAMKHTRAFSHLKENVMPAMEAKAKAEREKTGKTSGPRQSHFRQWWKYWRGRGEMMRLISKLSRFIACPRVTKRPIFGFVDSSIHPNDAVQVFPFADDYSFGILQSGVHWEWFKARCSSLKGDPRYTSNSVFDSFPWPQAPTLTQIKAVARAAVALRKLRRKVMKENRMSLRDLYRTLELPGKNQVRDAHAALDAAVRVVYGMNKRTDPLASLLELDLSLAEREKAGESVVGPGLPPVVKSRSAFATKDCIRMD